MEIIIYIAFMQYQAPGTAVDHLVESN